MINRSNKKDPDKNRDELSHQWNNLGLLFLIVPITALIWVARTKTVFPIDQANFLITSLGMLVVSFGFLWFLTFRRTQKNRVLYAISAFLFMLWCIGGLAGISKINMAWDDSLAKTHFVKITETRKLSGGVRMPKTPSCLAMVESSSLKVEAITLRYDECDSITAKVDGLQIELKDGFLGMPWMADHAIVKDYDLYKKRLNITD